MLQAEVADMIPPRVAYEETMMFSLTTVQVEDKLPPPMVAVDTMVVHLALFLASESIWMG